jgi:hypothetical protein
MIKWSQRWLFPFSVGVAGLGVSVVSRTRWMGKVMAMLILSIPASEVATSAALRTPENSSQRTKQQTEAYGTTSTR